MLPDCPEPPIGSLSAPCGLAPTPLSLPEGRFIAIASGGPKCRLFLHEVREEKGSSATTLSPDPSYELPQVKWEPLQHLGCHYQGRGYVASLTDAQNISVSRVCDLKESKGPVWKRHFQTRNDSELFNAFKVVPGTTELGGLLLAYDEDEELALIRPDTGESHLKLADSFKLKDDHAIEIVSSATHHHYAVTCEPRSGLPVIWDLADGKRTSGVRGFPAPEKRCNRSILLYGPSGPYLLIGFGLGPKYKGFPSEELERWSLFEGDVPRPRWLGTSRGHALDLLLPFPTRDGFDKVVVLERGKLCIWDLSRREPAEDSNPTPMTL